MRSGKPLTVLCLVAFILLVGVLTGCSGGGDQSGNASQDGAGKSGGKEEQQGGDKADKMGAAQTKILLGTIKSADAEKRKVIVKPSTEEQGKEPIVIKVKRNATITPNDEQAEVADIKEGQRAQITCKVKNERNLAREVTLISDDGANSGAGENTG